MVSDASQIKVLDFPDFIRKRPGMYVGDLATSADHMILELVANAVDQHLAGRVSEIVVHVDGCKVQVRDDGPGMPRENVRSLETVYCGVKPRNTPHVALAGWGVGLAPINALCRSFEVRSSDGRLAWSKSYRVGNPERQATAIDVSPKGTEIRMAIDGSLMAPPSVHNLRIALKKNAYLYPGLSFVLNEEPFIEPDGLKALAANKHDGAAAPELWYRGEPAGMWIDLALRGQAEEPAFSTSWVNGVEARFGGSHMRALERALARVGLRPAVQLFHLILDNPELGPTREDLRAPGIVAPLEAHLTEILRANG